MNWLFVKNHLVHEPISFTRNVLLLHILQSWASCIKQNRKNYEETQTQTHSIKYKHKLLNTVHKTPQSYKRRADGAQVFLTYLHTVCVICLLQTSCLRILIWSSQSLLLYGPWLPFQLEFCIQTSAERIRWIDS